MNDCISYGLNDTMRGRGAYRQIKRESEVIDRSRSVTPTASDKSTQKVFSHNDMKVVVCDDKRHVFDAKRLKPGVKTVTTNQMADVITIDSDDDIEEITEVDIIDKSDVEMIDDDEVQVVDSDYESTSTTLSLDDRPIRDCRRCLRRLTTNGYRDLEYNELTSADFYYNPRIHWTVLSHELKDKNRYNTYKKVIEDNKESFKGKTILVISSGTGLIALMAAKAGAKTVIIYDGRGIRELIEAVLPINRRNIGYQLKTKFHVMSELTDDTVLPDGIEKVDIIVSDWANHSLFYRSMFSEFIKARDKWLRKGGLIFPDSSHMYLMATHDNVHNHLRKDKRYSCSMFVKHIDYWDKNVYGFDMNTIKKAVILEPFHEYINNSQIVTNETLLRRFDFYKMTLNDINFETSFKLTTNKDDYLQAFVIVFDLIFSKTTSLPMMISTRPKSPKTVLRPTILFMDNKQHLLIYTDDKVIGNFKMSFSKDLNSMAINIDYRFKNKVCNEIKENLKFRTFS
ncbi:protein arginine N-methyltransferase 1-like [Oppia nitens]|uniref:protein arginine N-methyltransferase 1-like n=1 Tax=Oppia nitens TaxID=1686743 RepID=UPI0023DBEE56|nr:protein arginine N-methyltransferase 1-like [Oppia nitens]